MFLLSWHFLKVISWTVFFLEFRTHWNFQIPANARMPQGHCCFDIRLASCQHLLTKECEIQMENYNCFQQHSCVGRYSSKLAVHTKSKTNGRGSHLPSVIPELRLQSKAKRLMVHYSQQKTKQAPSKEEVVFHFFGILGHVPPKKSFLC